MSRFYNRYSNTVLKLLAVLLVGFTVYTFHEQSRKIELLIQQTQTQALDNGENNEEHRLRNEQVHDEIKDFLCDLVRLAPPDRVNEKQIEICANFPPAGGRQGTSSPPEDMQSSGSQSNVPVESKAPQANQQPQQQNSSPPTTQPQENPQPQQESILPFKKECTVNLLGVCI